MTPWTRLPGLGTAMGQEFKDWSPGTFFGFWLRSMRIPPYLGRTPVARPAKLAHPWARWPRTSRAGSAPKTCSHCGTQGHSQRYCPEKFR